MKSEYFLLAWMSFSKKNSSSYSTLNFIINGFAIATLLSFFIFLSIFEIVILNYIGCFLAIFGLYLLLNLDKKTWFWTGFFVGILWFYWISFSLVYYGFWYLIPLEIITIGLVYGLLFLIAGYFKSQILRAILLVALDYFYPFNFNWFNLELIFVGTIFKPSIWSLGAVLAGLILSKKFKFGFVILAILMLLNLNLKPSQPNLLPFSVELTNTQIDQNKKWDKKYTSDIIEMNIGLIHNAINNGAKFVILPETAFPLFLERQSELFAYLKELSKDITILTGSLGYENKTTYNSAFLFQNGNVKRFDKVVLVPFGEEVPLPKFMADFINKIFFGGSSDFSSAKSVSQYEIDGIKITNAICYEASRDEIYASKPKFVVAITNNAWFMPSTEPVLQKLLLKYYAFKYQTTIYHSVNGSKSEIITP
ncbi:apolipoprotein N-acyltransferase [Campylobacter iguaniorum]|uniref:apolipoprotein N-acyltransferase n=1 Tax=Campylobacter iguaniorum TaxID=1244531 RepID=UPI0007C99A33|nr:apolipoprotein N-acyltransferase [Campylobacter iguaniorum]ANE35784.1 apolipoprotein N-acyltransferase [Campylobacter iguaniorum]